MDINRAAAGKWDFARMITRRGLIGSGVAIAAWAMPARAEEPWRVIPHPAAAIAPAESGLAPVNGIKIYWASYGSGEPLLFLHGGMGNADAWGNQINEFAKTNRVVVMDSRGHGRSTRDDKPYTYELMASDVISLLDQLGLSKVSLVGWSDGGIIGLVLAMRHPERLKRVWAFGANFNPDGNIADPPDTEALRNQTKQDEVEYKRLSPTPDQFDTFKDVMNHMWDTEPNYTVDDLAKITVPVAIADGDHDEFIKRDHTALMARSIPSAKLVIMPGTSHFALWQKPAEYNAQLRAFLDGK